MAATRPSAAAAGAAACAAVAAWLSSGAISFVDAANGASYVGVLPPLSSLFLMAGAAAIIVAVVRPSARTVAPLWLSAVAVLPWLPIPLPLSVFVWTDHVLLWLWITIGLALVAPTVASALPSARLSPRRSAVLAACVATALYGLITWSVAPAHPDGDEPHYLVITQSLLNDHDILIENNHLQGDYQAYMDRSMKPDFLKRGLDGQIYSIHAPGLPLLVAPGFALFGYPGVLIELVLLSGIAAGVLWLVTWRVTQSAAATWFGWAAVTLSVPFAFHAGAVFPDGLGAVLVVAALLPLVDARARQAGVLVFVGASLAALPWLSSRFVVLAVAAGGVIAARILSDPIRRVSKLAAFAFIPILSGVGFVLFFQLIYGTPNPSVVYGETPTMTMSVGNLVRGVPGLLFDQQFGLLSAAPVFLCAGAGLAVMLRRGPRRLGLELALVAFAYFLVGAGFTSWWGGTTAPARYVTPITPLLAIPAACWFARIESAGARTAGYFALLVSVLTTATMALVDRGAFVFNFRDGMSRVAMWLSPVIDLTRALPSMFQNGPAVVWLQAAVWLAAVASAVAAALYASRRRPTSAVLAFGLTLELTVMVAVSTVWWTNGALVVAPGAGGAALLRRLDPGSAQLALGFRPFRRLDIEELPAELVLARAFSAGSSAESATLARVPAGTYEVSGTLAAPVTGRIRVRTDRVSGPLAEWDASALDSTWRRQVTLPVAVASLQFEADPGVREALRDVSIRARSVSSRETGGAREARRGAKYGTSSVFLMDGTAWVEPTGIWVAADSSAEFAIAAESPAPVQLFVRNGPVENVASLESGGWHDTLTLRPGEERVVPIPAIAGRPTTPLRVHASTGFRPSEVDPRSDDRRQLGLWIETR
jgi:hypothetical protein